MKGSFPSSLVWSFSCSEGFPLQASTIFSYQLQFQGQTDNTFQFQFSRCIFFRKYNGAFHPYWPNIPLLFVMKKTESCRSTFPWGYCQQTEVCFIKILDLIKRPLFFYYRDSKNFFQFTLSQTNLPSIHQLLF